MSYARGLSEHGGKINHNGTFCLCSLNHCDCQKHLICRLSITGSENVFNTEVPDEVPYEVPYEMSYEVPNEVPCELHTSNCPRFQVTRTQLHSIELVADIDCRCSICL
jgi:hypothetical protein